MPLRLRLATHSAVIEDDELRQLATGDLRFILTRRPELAPEIVSVYRSASQPGRKFIEAALEKLDPNLLRTVRGIH